MVKINKSLLVIGGTGFIGSNLLKKAKKLGFSSTSISLRKPNKKNFVPGVKYIMLDITKKEKLKKLKGNFDIIVNAGGYGGLDENFKNKNKMYKDQYDGLKNISSHFLNKRITKFVQIGSSLEYGQLSKINRENDKTIYPLTIYGRAKLRSTDYLLFLYKVFNFPVTILRLYQVYGPHQKTNRFIPYIIKSAIKRDNIYTSAGNQIRDFCYIDDVVDAILKSFDNKKTIGEIINIGYGKGFKIKHVLQKILKILKYRNFKGKIKKNIPISIKTKNLYPPLKKLIIY